MVSQCLQWSTNIHSSWLCYALHVFICIWCTEFSKLILRVMLLVCVVAEAVEETRVYLSFWCHSAWKTTWGKMPVTLGKGVFTRSWCLNIMTDNFLLSNLKLWQHYSILLPKQTTYITTRLTDWVYLVKIIYMQNKI